MKQLLGSAILFVVVALGGFVQSERLGRAVDAIGKLICERFNRICPTSFLSMNLQDEPMLASFIDSKGIAFTSQSVSTAFVTRRPRVPFIIAFQLDF